MQVGDAAGADIGLEIGLLGDLRAGQDFLDNERLSAGCLAISRQMRMPWISAW